MYILFSIEGYFALEIIIFELIWSCDKNFFIS